MNQYQEKLEAIKARRLSWLQRLFSVLASASLLCAALFMVPLVISVIGSFMMSGMTQNHTLLNEFGVTGLVITVLAIPALCYLIYHCFSWSLKHFVRTLSGIRES
jgi:uncharacterized protein involved in cysteine biosynthesis